MRKITKYIITYKEVPFENLYARMAFPGKYIFKNIFAYCRWLIKTKKEGNIIIFAKDNEPIIIRECLIKK